MNIVTEENVGETSLMNKLVTNAISDLKNLN